MVCTGPLYKERGLGARGKVCGAPGRSISVPMLLQIADTDSSPAVRKTSGIALGMEGEATAEKTSVSGRHKKTSGGECAQNLRNRNNFPPSTKSNNRKRGSGVFRQQNIGFGWESDCWTQKKLTA